MPQQSSDNFYPWTCSNSYFPSNEKVNLSSFTKPFGRAMNHYLNSPLFYDNGTRENFGSNQEFYQQVDPRDQGQSVENQNHQNPNFGPSYANTSEPYQNHEATYESNEYSDSDNEASRPQSIPCLSRNSSTFQTSRDREFEPIRSFRFPTKRKPSGLKVNKETQPHGVSVSNTSIFNANATTMPATSSNASFNSQDKSTSTSDAEEIKITSFVKCPHCSRKFQEESARRHIPICASFTVYKKKLNAERMKRFQDNKENLDHGFQA